MDELIQEPQIVMLGHKEIKLDPSLMNFNEHTLSQYLEKEAGWYSFYGSVLAEAEFIQSRLELAHDVLYSERYKGAKEGKVTEKLAENIALSDPDVVEAKKAFIAAKYKTRLIQQYLRAWDRAHENAQSRGHFLRKEMDRLGNRILGEPLDADVDGQMDELFRNSER